MRAWVWMLGGLILWGVHFLGVYVIASIADVVARADHPFGRMVALGFSVLCVLAGAALGLIAFRRLRGVDPEQEASRFHRELTAMGYGVAVVAMIWQALPTLTGY